MAYNSEQYESIGWRPLVKFRTIADGAIRYLPRAAANCPANSRLIAEAAREAGVASPLFDVCQVLGFGDADMAAVFTASRRAATYLIDNV